MNDVLPSGSASMTPITKFFRAQEEQLGGGTWEGFYCSPSEEAESACPGRDAMEGFPCCLSISPSNIPSPSCALHSQSRAEYQG